MICRNHVDVSEGVRRCSRCGSTFCRDCLVAIGGSLFCATCKSEQLLDVRSGVPPSALDLAPISRRFWAYVLDAIILFFVNMAISAALRIAIQTGASPLVGCISVLLSLVVHGIYHGALIAKMSQTVGKMALKIKVVAETGARVSTGQAWGRAFAAMIPFAQVVALFNDERKGIHDMLAHTRVVNA